MIKLSKIRQLLALVIILAVLALAAAIALKAYRGMRGGPVLPSLPKNIEVSLQKIHFTESKGGEKKWDLLADKAEYDKSGEVVRLTGIRLEVAAAGKTGDIVLTSERAAYYTRTRDVELFGNVVAKSASGMEFTTGRVAYVAASSMLRTADRVRFSDGNLAVVGIGMEFMVNRKQLKILRQVAASYTPGTARP
ncbi:MAG: LPS export ABC transporter periplasmic protein LptC [Geobacteraceae bacterium]|nr:LPS export ABC transporter periplasmic protein LptC [Geobacteraceae bacterium]